LPTERVPGGRALPRRRCLRISRRLARQRHSPGHAVGPNDVSIDRIGVDGQAQPFLTAEQLGVDGIGYDTFAVDAPRNRLLLKVYSGTLIKPQDRRLIWVDLRTRDISPAMDAPLRRLDAPFAAVFGPGGDVVAFTVGRAAAGATDAPSCRARRGAICPETASASHWHGADVRGCWAICRRPEPRAAGGAPAPPAARLHRQHADPVMAPYAQAPPPPLTRLAELSLYRRR
jgi:hypothetical protein